MDDFIDADKINVTGVQQSVPLWTDPDKYPEVTSVDMTPNPTSYLLSFSKETHF